jgi:hypothetical protein
MYRAERRRQPRRCSACKMPPSRQSELWSCPLTPTLPMNVSMRDWARSASSRHPAAPGGERGAKRGTARATGCQQCPGGPGRAQSQPRLVAAKTSLQYFPRRFVLAQTPPTSTSLPSIEVGPLYSLLLFPPLVAISASNSISPPYSLPFRSARGLEKSIISFASRPAGPPCC